MGKQPANTIDYRQANAADPFVPNPALLASSGWDSLYLEVHHQPKFEIAEHQHTMYTIACGLDMMLDVTGRYRSSLASWRSNQSLFQTIGFGRHRNFLPLNLSL